MIVDHINHSSKYHSLGRLFREAFHFLGNINPDLLETGIHEMDGKDLFCIISENVTTPITNTSLEAHIKYIDIHYVISGSEIIGYASKARQRILKEYDPDEDYALYNGDMSLIKLEAGMFAIFYPNDLHMPGISETKGLVKKVVIKVRISN